MNGKVMMGWLGVVLFATAGAWGQSYESDGGSSYGYAASPIYSPRFGWGRASTYQEGLLRGWGDYIRARGEYNYNTSLAMVHAQEARRRAIENRKAAVKAYFDLKELNHERRFGNQERPTQADFERYAQARLPEALAGHQYQRALGKLHWPPVLQRPEFDEIRTALDQAVAERTVENSGIGSENYQQICQLVDLFESKLKASLNQLTTDESISARKFLASLKYEARSPLEADATGLALR